MNTLRNKYYLLNRVFISCLIILLANDHYLKFSFPGWLTGKLSDAVGIIMLPLLLAYAFPKWKYISIPLTALLFIFWKSPYSQSFIDAYNALTWIQTSRILDDTDLYVLLLLPLPLLLLMRIEQFHFLKLKNLHPLVVLVPAVFGLMATSPPPGYYYRISEGNLKCYNCDFTVNYREDEVVEKLRQYGMIMDTLQFRDTALAQRASSLSKTTGVDFYRVNELIIDQDTLRNLDFAIHPMKDKTKIYFNGMQVEKDISHYKLEKKLRKYYKRILFRELKRTLKR